MDAPTADELRQEIGLPENAAIAAVESALGVAIEYVEAQVGKLSVRTVRTATVTEAVLLLGKHVYNGRRTANAMAGRVNNAEQTPGMYGFLVPNRVASLLDQCRYDDPTMIGIG